MTAEGNGGGGRDGMSGAVLGGVHGGVVVGGTERIGARGTGGGEFGATSVCGTAEFGRGVWGE